MPLTFLPYMILFLTTPNMLWHIFSSVSAINSKGNSSLALIHHAISCCRVTRQIRLLRRTKSLYLSRAASLQ